MLGNYYTFPELLIWIPFVSGLIILFFKKNPAIKWIALFSSLFTLAVSLTSLFYADPAASLKNFTYYNVSYYWMPYLGTSFRVGLDGIGLIITFLTAVVFPLTFLTLHQKEIKSARIFYSLLLFLEACLMGVFSSYDILLLFIFWLMVFTLIYFINNLSQENEGLDFSFKTFGIFLTSSVLMLIGILSIYQLTPQQDTFSTHSFSLNAFYSTQIGLQNYFKIFGLFFLSFAVTLPLFPFHTWFTSSSDRSPYASTLLTGSVVTKMGAYFLLRLVIPLFPLAIVRFQHWLIGLALAGYFYAGIVAYGQKDLKKMAVWICVSTMGLVAVGIFAMNASSLRGAMLEMFNQGINIIGLFAVFYLIREKTGDAELSALNGLFQRSKILTIFLIIILLAILGFPLTNSFTSKKMIFSGLYDFNKWFWYASNLGFLATILYLWQIVKHIFRKRENDQEDLIAPFKLSATELIALAGITILIIVIGIYPDLFLHLIKEPVNALINKGKSLISPVLFIE